MRVIEVVIETQGRVGMASREVGRTVDSGEYILNTALHYAFGFAAGRYADTLGRPTYLEDTESVVEELYITPAAPLTPPNHLTTTYNARGDRYATINYDAANDPDQDKNLPRFGRERAFTHGNRFRTYVIPGTRAAESIDRELPVYIRLGKKRGKAKLHTRLVSARRESGSFRTNHPISAYDHDRTPLQNVIAKNMRPTPLILQADYDGEHLIIPQEDGDPIKLPAGLQFLKEKR
jgi:CRISPR-associated protein Csc1